MRKKNAPVSLATALAMRVLPVPGGPYKRIPRGGLDTNSFEEARMSEGKLHHFLDLRQLLSASSDVVITNGVQGILFIFPSDRFSLTMNDSIWSHNAIRSWISLHDLELHCSHS